MLVKDYVCKTNETELKISKFIRKNIPWKGRKALKRGPAHRSTVSFYEHFTGCLGLRF
jgi:hypothetical protein